jgi:hypothetical protein
MALYSAGPTDADQTLCEWCGRRGEVLPLKITGQVLGVGQPMLCEICQGLLAISHPHRGRRAKNRQEPERQQFNGWNESRRTVWQLLMQRYTGEGRPPPPWESRSPS